MKNIYTSVNGPRTVYGARVHRGGRVGNTARGGEEYADGALSGGGFRRMVDAREQHGSGDLVEQEIDERMVAPELVRFRGPGRPGHDERRGRRRDRALFVDGDLRLVHRVVDRHAVGRARQRRQVGRTAEQVSDAHLLEDLNRSKTHGVHETRRRHDSKKKKRFFELCL